MTLTTTDIHVRALLLGGYADAHGLPAPVPLCPVCRCEIYPADGDCGDGGPRGCPLPKGRP
jgi:hypothetical protein